MFSCRDVLLILVIASCVTTHAQEARYPDIGRTATSVEIQAWDIDVRADFQGLPKGSGTVQTGQAIWDKRCAACHGVFGESGEFASPIVGGTTADDIKTGHVARLADPSYPERTTLMRLTTVSTLWDYIHRAMPWNAPKSLSADEVYALTAYVMFMGGIVAEDFVLSDESIAAVQGRLPNRNGGTTEHSMWPGRNEGRRLPDTHNTACMKDCETLTHVVSTLPVSARNSHGNLVDQNRLVGPQRGADTSQPSSSTLGESVDAIQERQARGSASYPASISRDEGIKRDLQQKFACTTCHDIQRKVFGPSFQDISKKYTDNPDAVRYLADKIRSGGKDVWSELAMPPQNIDQGSAELIARWLVRDVTKDGAGSAHSR
jgi:cytochrome c551/c552/mono/diheme cytochrome c family protein